MHDVIIIGAGPAGLAAALTCAELKLKVLLLAKEIPVHAEDEAISLVAFEKLQEFIAKQKNNTSLFLDIELKREVVNLEKNIVSFSAEVKDGKLYYARSVIVATGGVGREGSSSFETISHKTPAGKIKVNSSMQTNILGLFAAGQVTDMQVENTSLAIAEGVRTAFFVREYLSKTSK